MISIEHFVTKFRFMNDVCPYRYHWCNGKHIPDIDPLTNEDKSNFVDLSPCKHYINKRCKHPEKKNI